MIYALIHGFCQDGRSVFRGGLKYIMAWTKLSKQTCISILQGLVKKGLIVRCQNKNPFDTSQAPVEYYTLRSRGKKNEPEKSEKKDEKGGQKTEPGQESLPDRSNFLTSPGQNSLPNNNIGNSKDIATASQFSEIKELSEKYFGKNAFDITFPAKAAAFLQERGIENVEKYLAFIRNKVDEKMKTAEVPIKSPRSFAYKLIFEIDIAQEFLNREKDEEKLSNVVDEKS